MRKKLAAIFASRSQAEWCEVFDGEDACVEPVVELGEAQLHPHNKDRKSFLQVITNFCNNARSHTFNVIILHFFKQTDGSWHPKPAPLLSRTPGSADDQTNPVVGEHSLEILESLGFTPKQIQDLSQEKVVLCQSKSSL